MSSRCSDPRRAAILAGVVAALAAPIARADGAPPPLEIHYAPGENLERIDVGLIEQAGVSIDMAAYVLTDAAVIEALADAAARGVAVRVWREASTAGYGDAEALARLAAAGAALRVKPRGDLMHLKSYCVDGALLRTGAANFSASGETRQDNDLIVLRGPSACDRFNAAFANMWGDRE